MKLQLVTAREDWGALAPEWEALRARTDRPDPFVSFPWVRLWLGHHAGTAAPWFVTVRDATGLRAIAPLVLSRGGHREGIGRLRSRWHSLARSRVLGFPVDGATGPARCDFLLDRAPHATRAAWLSALFEFILAQRAAWDRLRLCGLHEHSTVRRHLASADTASRATARTAARLHATSEQDLSAARVMPAPTDFGAWLRAGSAQLRKDVRYNRNSLATAGGMQFTTARTPAEVAHGMHAVRRILLARYGVGQVAGLPSADQSVIAFFERVVADFAARGAVDLRLLTHHGQPLSCVLSLVEGTRIYPLLTKYDPAQRALSPGRAILLHLIEHAARDGYTHIDFLSDWTYLRRFTERTERYLATTAYHAGWRSQLARWRARRDAMP